MSNPTAIQLDGGDSEQIISKSDLSQGVPYLVEVVGSNPVRYSHEKRNADRGVTLSAGTTHTLSNFRGEGIYVAAFDGPSAVRVREAGAAVETQPNKAVRVEGDVNIGSEVDITDDQTREIGKARLMDSNGVLVDPPTEAKQDQIINLLQQIETNTSP